MQCPHCGNYVADGTSYCPSCGAPQTAPAAPTYYNNPNPESNPYGQPAGNPNPYGQTAGNPNPYGQPAGNPNPYGQPVTNPYGNPNPYGQPNPYGNPYGMPDPNMKQAQPYHGLAIASLVLGILSFFCFGLIAGGLAIVFAAIAKGNGNKSGVATAGLVCGIVGFVLTLISLTVIL